MLQPLPLPASHCAFMSSASIPRCGSPRGSGFGRSTIAGSICSWSGGGTTAPNDPTLRLAQGCPELRRRARIQRSKGNRSQTWGESRTDKLVGRLSLHCSKGFPWELDRWELTALGKDGAAAATE